MGPIPLYAGFALTGVGLALPGALLPALLGVWHLKDEAGGLLFLMAWIGSSAGALLVRGSLRTALSLGCAALAFASAMLALCGGRGANAWMGLYGCGLGLTMTAISLIRQQQARRPGAEMVRLNLLWAIGACVCPTLTVSALAGGAIAPMLLTLSGSFLLLAIWAARQKDVSLTNSPGSSSFDLARIFRLVPLALLLMIFLVTGVEASIGGWLATYARRGAAGTGHALALTVAAPTCLWAGLLLSRAVWSLWAQRFTQGSLIRGSLALLSGGALLLLLARAPELVLAASFCLGFGFGPVYPLLLSAALRASGGGAVFFLAGVGSAVLPWLTGWLSTARGSLRLGLVVPLAGSLVMLVLGLVSPLSAWSAEE